MDNPMVYLSVTNEISGLVPQTLHVTEDETSLCNLQLFSNIASVSDET